MTLCLENMVAKGHSWNQRGSLENFIYTLEIYVCRALMETNYLYLTNVKLYKELQEAAPKAAPLEQVVKHNQVCGSVMRGQGARPTSPSPQK